MLILGVWGFGVTRSVLRANGPQSCAAGSASPSCPENSGLQAHAVHSLGAWTGAPALVLGAVNAHLNLNGRLKPSPAPS